MSYHVRTQEISMSTGESGSAEILSSHINGQLYGFSFQSGKQVSLRLSLSDLDVSLYEQRAIQGERYIPLLARAHSDNGEVYNFAQVPWFIDDSIKIFVKGSVQSLIKIKLFYLED